MSDPKVIVIGAGISGLSTAWWLAEQGISVEVWESKARIGGKIESTSNSGYLTESAAGLLVNFRNEIDQLIKRCNLTQSKRQRPGDLKRYVLHDNRLCCVPMTIGGMARSHLLSRRGKLRLLGEGLIFHHGEPGESVSQFIQRRFGREMLHTAIDPFVSGTLASDPDLAEAASVLPRLKALEEQYGSITNGILVNKLWKRRRINKADTFSFTGGMSQLINAMADHPGIHIRKNISLQRVERNRNGWQLHAYTSMGELNESCQQLVITAPADVAGRLLAPLDRNLGQLLSSIEYAPMAVLHMGLERRQVRHPLDGTGFLVAKRAGVKLNGNLWMSSLFPQRAPAGKILLTSYLGGARHPELLQLPDEQLIEQTQTELSRLLGIEVDPDYIRLHRHSQGLPLYHGHYQAKLAQINIRLHQYSGLHLCGNYAGGVSVRERIYQGKLATKQILQTAKRKQNNLYGIEQPKPYSTIPV